MGGLFSVHQFIISVFIKSDHLQSILINVAEIKIITTKANIRDKISEIPDLFNASAVIC